MHCSVILFEFSSLQISRKIIGMQQSLVSLSGLKGLSLPLLLLPLLILLILPSDVLFIFLPSHLSPDFLFLKDNKLVIVFLFLLLPIVLLLINIFHCHPIIIMIITLTAVHSLLYRYCYFFYSVQINIFKYSCNLVNMHGFDTFK